MKCRNNSLYRVVHTVYGKRRAKNFSSLADAKADAKNFINEIYTQPKAANHCESTDLPPNARPTRNLRIPARTRDLN